MKYRVIEKFSLRCYPLRIVLGLFFIMVVTVNFHVVGITSPKDIYNWVKKNPKKAAAIGAGIGVGALGLGAASYYGYNRLGNRQNVDVPGIDIPNLLQNDAQRSLYRSRFDQMQKEIAEFEQEQDPTVKRRKLRALNLKYHPDKAVSRSVDEHAVNTELFKSVSDILSRSQPQRHFE